MTKKVTEPREFAPEELIRRIDKAIRDPKTNAAQLLKLQTRREKLMKQINGQKASVEEDTEDAPSSEFNDGELRVLNGKSHLGPLTEGVRALLEELFREDHRRLSEKRAEWEGSQKQKTPDEAAVEPEKPVATVATLPATFPPPPPNTGDPITNLRDAAKRVEDQGLNPIKLLRPPIRSASADVAADIDPDVLER